MNALLGLLALFSVLVPQKVWYPPNQPVMVQIKSDADLALVMTDFAGKVIAPQHTANVAKGATVNVDDLFPAIASPGTFVLYAVPEGATFTSAPKDFLGTPIVIEVRQDRRQGAPSGPMVRKVSPLSYAVMTTDMGSMTAVFYYDDAPGTVDSFLSLAAGGYFDGLVFHRIIPGFVIQGGDPRGFDPETAGTGGPGYQLDAEFNDRKHEAGVLSMARNGDPNERTGAMPRPEFADSAGSQFFICLDYAQTQALDHKYTAFGRIVDGLDVMKAIAAVKTNPANDRPEHPPVIKTVDVLGVTKDHNPYAAMMQRK